MFITGVIGCLLTTVLLTVMSAVYGGTSNKVGNGFGVFAIFLYLAFEGSVKHLRPQKLLT